jgi:predicted nucleotidyltransferase
MDSLFDQHHQEFLKILNHHQVEYLLIGGMAVNLYGYNRGTGDLDIWIGGSGENKIRLVAAINDFGFDTSDYEKIGVEEITMFSLGSRQEPGHIEITNRIAGIEFEDAYIRVQVKEIDGIEMKFIHFNDLIRNKLASARPKDLDDVENLNRINKKSS